MNRKDEVLKEIKSVYKKTRRPIWKATYDMLNVPVRKERRVNISKLDKLVPAGAYVVVPGKVLGSGTLSKKLIVGAYDFSASAVEKIKRAKGKPLYLDKFAKKFGKKEGLILIGG